MYVNKEYLNANGFLARQSFNIFSSFNLNIIAESILLLASPSSLQSRNIFGVYLGVRTCELFLCFVAIVRVRAIMLTSLFSLFYVTGEFHRFLNRGRARL